MAALDVISLDEAKQAVNVTGTTEHDTELALWITAVSQRLDELVGPVVVRTITGEAHDGGRCLVMLAHYPVTSITSVSEYDSGTQVPLTAETLTTRPAAGYLADRYEPNPALLSRFVRRRSNGADAEFAAGRGNVVVSYSAGRFADTASVDPRFKAAANLMLINLWRSQQSSVGSVGEFDTPMSNFPTFAVPRAVREMLARELQEPIVGIA
ncbi:hypothetical protein AB0L13_16615 [Saccharopolyspora shandongensis]|uniref:hypothetical protein n=1 Tax=Saccharopolyspora shandongensis TaxID=418495 RepID=UPI0034174FEE